LVEFTGERVVPGKVGADLWNEHFSRYAFAARAAHGKRILDVGSGKGYGAAELARVAASVIGVDNSNEAVRSATETYPIPNLSFRNASAEALPFDAASFDLIVAFEVIEHVENWRGILAEVRRVLAPAGQFLVSTPNRLYYAETRGQAGPNPFHVHEFTFDEFRSELEKAFPSVLLFLQNHVEGIAFQPLLETRAPAEVAAGFSAASPDEAHFFVGLCALSPAAGPSAYVYLPSTGNLLREREQHIGLLEAEVATKNDWLQKSEGERAVLTETLERERRLAQEATEGYRQKVAELEADLARRTEVFQANEQRIEQELRAQLDRSVQMLHHTEAILAERTEWALRLQTRGESLERDFQAIRSSLWFRLGRTFGAGPDLSRY
jgi:ubiquinone/menaquinone biosynthesis C-methylase UbiE